jgi:hypothetical protein
MRPIVDWESREPGRGFARAEIKRLLRRARPRRWLIVLCAILASAGFVTKRILFPAPQTARISFRLIEADLDLTKALHPHRGYLDYVWGVLLSSPRLLEVIKAYDLYPDKYAKDPRLAVEALRDDLDVKVWRNYFIEDHYDNDDEARSVRFSVEWKSKDPRVLEVVQALGHTIVAAQTEERRQVFRQGQQELIDATQEAAGRLEVIRRAIAERRLALSRGEQKLRPRLEVELRDLTVEEKELAKRTSEVDSARSRFDITAALEQQRSGLRFELVDPGYVIPGKEGPTSMALTAALIFAGAAFLSGLLLGAFETRIRQPEDVRRLGIPVLAAVVPFPGDTSGTLTERLRAEDRLR